MAITNEIAVPDPTQELSPRGRFFANPTFHFETLRNVGYTLARCADIGEVLETLKHITEGDTQSWYAAWSATADRVLARAERTRDARSQGDAYMRASTYQRTGEFLLAPDDPRRPASFAKTGSLFYKGLDALGVRYESFSAPYECGRLRALYLPGPAGSEAKPLIVLVGGYDSILEELYPVLGEAALQRGYSVLMYEGPGQGEPLRKYGLTFTPEWEKPNAAVLDEFLRTHARPAKMVLIGMSFGGYLAPRAAAFEPRLDGLVAFDQCTDAFESGAHIVRAAANPAAMKDPGVAWLYRNALWTFGTKGIEDTCEAGAAYQLLPVANRIRQDVLILAGTEDQFNAFHQVDDFAKALVNARSVTTQVFDSASGGAAHCQAGCLSLVHAAVFDWLLDKFPGPSRS